MIAAENWLRFDQDVKEKRKIVPFYRPVNVIKRSFVSCLSLSRLLTSGEQQPLCSARYQRLVLLCWSSLPARGFMYNNTENWNRVEQQQQLDSLSVQLDIYQLPPDPHQFHWDPRSRETGESANPISHYIQNDSKTITPYSINPFRLSRQSNCCTSHSALYGYLIHLQPPAPGYFIEIINYSEQIDIVTCLIHLFHLFH